MEELSALASSSASISMSSDNGKQIIFSDHSDKNLFMSFLHDTILVLTMLQK